MKQLESLSRTAWSLMGFTSWAWVIESYPRNDQWTKRSTLLIWLKKKFNIQGCHFSITSLALVFDPRPQFPHLQDFEHECNPKPRDNETHLVPSFSPKNMRCVDWDNPITVRSIISTETWNDYLLCNILQLPCCNKTNSFKMHLKHHLNGDIFQRGKPQSFQVIKKKKSQNLLKLLQQIVFWCDENFSPPFSQLTFNIWVLLERLHWTTRLQGNTMNRLVRNWYFSEYWFNSDLFLP